MISYTLNYRKLNTNLLNNPAEKGQWSGESKLLIQFSHTHTQLSITQTQLWPFTREQAVHKTPKPPI